MVVVVLDVVFGLVVLLARVLLLLLIVFVDEILVVVVLAISMLMLLLHKVTCKRKIYDEHFKMSTVRRRKFSTNEIQICFFSKSLAYFTHVVVIYLHEKHIHKYLL